MSSAKKVIKFQDIHIHIDRPKGFVQEGKDSSGTPWKRVYKYDYGFIKGTTGGDKEALDVFVGPNKSSHDTFWAIQKKDDGSFDEYKVFVGFSSEKDATEAYVAHIPKKLLAGMMSVPIGMMKALLNKEPSEKTAQHLAFFDELSRLAGAHAPTR